MGTADSKAWAAPVAAAAAASARVPAVATAAAGAAETHRSLLIASLRCLDARRFSLKDWHTALAEAFGFDDVPLQCSGRFQCECTDGFCALKQRRLLLSTASSGTDDDEELLLLSPGGQRFNARSRVSRIATYLEYHHVPAHVSAVENFCVHCVACERDGLAVLHLARDGTSRFALVSITGRSSSGGGSGGRRRYLGCFGNYYSRHGGSAAFFRGRLSIGGRYFLLVFTVDGALGQAAGSSRQVLHLYRLAIDGGQHTLAGEYRLPDSSSLLDVTFDPRRAHEVVAMAVRCNSNSRSNSSSAAGGGGGSSSSSIGDVIVVTTLRTSDWSPLARLELSAAAGYLAALDYAPCGTRLLLQLIQHGELVCRSQKQQLLRVLDGDSLRPIAAGGRCSGSSVLSYQAVSADGESLTTCIAHSCPTNYRPVFSGCGSLAALPCLDAPAAEVRVLRLPSPLDLRHMCRRLIRQHWSADEVRRLLLPPPLISYLLFEAATAAVQPLPAADIACAPFAPTQAPQKPPPNLNPTSSQRCGIGGALSAAFGRSATSTGNYAWSSGFAS